MERKEGSVGIYYWMDGEAVKCKGGETFIGNKNNVYEAKNSVKIDIQRSVSPESPQIKTPRAHRELGKSQKR